MFGKFFKKKSLPTKDGDLRSEKTGKHKTIKIYELILSNMEGTPIYELRHQLSVGSEIGNIIIADPSISPRHASFILQEEVVSVIDHGSVSGTYINGKKIDPGKYIILEETDVVLLGELELKLKAGTVSVPEDEIPDLPAPKKVEEKKVAAEPAKPEFNAREHLKNNQKNTKKKTTLAISKPDAANSIVRVLSVVCDFIIANTVIIIFMPFDEFRHFLEFIPGFVSSLLSEIDWSIVLDPIKADYGFVLDMAKEGYEFIVASFHFGPLLLVFILLRLVMTLLIGVSLGEFLLGLSGTGNKLWARVGGVLRVFVGVVTGPLLVFDVPAIVSRRTFKEVVTFTAVASSSKFITILSVIFVIPILLAVMLVAPLFQGLEVPRDIIVNDKIEKRIKVKLDGEQTSETQSLIVTEVSSKLGLGIEYDQKDLLIIPELKFQGAGNKLKVKSGLVFYQKDQKRFVELEIFKTFDLKQLLGIAMKGNVFLYDKYPQIYNYVYELVEKNPSFKKQLTARDHLAFSNEFIEFTKSAFSLNVETMIDYVQEQTPLLQGIIDYRSSFYALMEYKDFDQIGFIKIGEIVFLKISFNRQRPFDLVMPIMKGEGRIYKVTYDKKEQYSKVGSKFYKFNLNKSDWMAVKENTPKEIMSPLDVFDLTSDLDLAEQIIKSEKAQGLYGYYFETSREVLSSGDETVGEIWKNEVKNLLKMIESIPAKPLVEGESDSRTKLTQNFKDLIDALESNNREYFGATQTTL